MLFSKSSNHLLHSLSQAESIKNRLISEQQNENISELQQGGHMIFWYFECLHLMYSEVAWVLVSSGTQDESQIILEPGYLSHYLSVFYDYDYMVQ